MLIVGTAGHIDHGKTTLVRALTGMDTDRLAEEKRRGISIDLGFAHLPSEEGEPVSFIDVPGHERFIKNMLAGAGGIDAVLLVVAADEGVKPQTREHFQICRLLRVSTGLIALTKIDSATQEQVAQAKDSVAALVKGSFLEGSPMVAISAKTGEGLPRLREALGHLVRTKSGPAKTGLARLNVDRSFSAKGFGTVVTGTLLGGRLQVNDAVQLHPLAKPAKIRTLQVHGKSVDHAQAGERAAVNLAGINHTEIQRGFVLTHRNELTATSLLDASVEWLEGEAVPTRKEEFLLHSGTAETVVQLKAVGPGLVRLWLSEPALILPGDRFILRRPSPASTVGGGVVLDAFPPARLNRSKLQVRLAHLQTDSPTTRLEWLVGESGRGRRLPDLVKQTGLPSSVLRESIAESKRLVVIEATQLVISQAYLEAARQKLAEWLRAFHAKNPHAPGAPISQARLHLDPNIAAAVFANFPDVRITGETIALTTHKAQSNPEQIRLLAAVEHAFRQAGFQPPPPSTLLQQAGLDALKGRPFLEALIKAQRLVRVSDEIVFHAEVIAQIRRKLGVQKGRKFSIPEFKEWTQVSRKYAVPLLEYLDRQHVTRREGDARVVL